LFVGAMGKSAQIGLHTWLPDAMEGPTPVSALIHAATMVTAGVFLVCRCSPLFQLAPHAAEFVTFIGATTAFFAASVGLFQNDIKRVIAYSTCSQLGYMFAAAGVASYDASMFHLFTHAFFKALLFLSAGAVITSMHHEQDMRKMGGLWKAIPFTWAMMLIGNLALTGVGIPYLGVGLAGFYSKDAIINATWNAHTAIGSYAFTLLLVAAGMTSFYSWRQFLMTFHGRYRGLDHQHLSHSDASAHGEPTDGHDEHHAPKLEDIHESPITMLVPLAVLALGAAFAGMIFFHYFIGDGANAFWNNSIFVAPAKEGELPMWVELGPLVLTIIGFLVAYYYYILHPDLPRKLAAKRGMLYVFLYNKWYFDELYDFLFVRPAFWIGRFLWKRGDGTIIDGLGPDGISARVLDAARGAVRLQSGYVYHYALAMLLGVVALATWFMASGGGL
jgi:NADH-quinone oxidoreductase subunit L